MIWKIFVTLVATYASANAIDSILNYIKSLPIKEEVFGAPLYIVKEVKNG